MKTKLYKIMAIAVTVSILVSLMIGGFASPAAAKDLKWSKEGPPAPGEDGDWFWDTDINGFGYLGMAIDGTMYAYVYHDDEGDMLLQSTDSGRSWEDLKYSGGPVVDIAFSPEDADSFWVADGAKVYRTTNAGGKFTSLTTTTDDGTINTITALAVGYFDDKAYLYIGADGGGGFQDVYMLPSTLGANWQRQSCPTIDDADSVIYDVFCAPDFNDVADPLVMIVAYDDSLTTPATSVYYRYGGGGWEGTTMGPEIVVEAAIDSAIIAVPEDFESDESDGYLEFFVAVDDGAGTNGGVYWFVTDNNIDQVFDDADVVSIDIAGEIGTGTIMVGGTDGKVYYNDNYGGGSWDDANPAGDGNTYVLMAEDFLDSEQAWALVEGTDQSLTMTTDLKSFPSISLIDAEMAAVNDFAVGSLFIAASNTRAVLTAAGDTITITATSASTEVKIDVTAGAADTAASTGTYNGTTDTWELNDTETVVLEATADGTTFDYNLNDGSIAIGVTYDAVGTDADSQVLTDGLWRYDDENWERIVTNNNIDFVAYSPDETLFYADATTPQIYWSTNDGDSFRKQNNTPDNEITAWLILDDSTIIVGQAGGIQRTTNSGTTWSDFTSIGGSDIVSMAASPDYDADETILLGNASGDVFISTNGGKDWKQKGSSDFSGSAGGDTYVAFDPGYADNNIYYVAGNDGDEGVIDICNDGTWDNIFTEDAGATVTATGLVVTSDGTLYATANPFNGVLRCLNPTDPPPDVEFEQVDDRYLEVPLDNLQVTSGSNVLWGVEYGAKDIYTYTDTLTGSPTLTSPSDGSSSERVDSAKLAWNDMDGAKEYQFIIGDDPGFDGWSDDENDELSLTSYTYPALDAGQTYYWKVRVTAPLLSRWSETWEFTTDLGAGEWNPFIGGVPEAPANGATNVPLQPTFAWNAADWATGYEFVLASDAAFTDALVSKTGANALTTTVYLCEQELTNSTTYYWKVRAVSKTSGSEWSTAVFTTEDPAPAAPTAPPTATPIPEAETPVYIWVIIGVGAALVIAVIILIVRTRRVA